MKALIMAAGQGSRLGYQVKGIIEINGKCILQRQVDFFNKYNISTYIVTGYERDKIISKIKNAKFIHNKNWKKENSASLLAGLENIGIDEDIIVCDGDIIYEESLLKEIINQEKTSYLIDFNKKSPDDMGVILEDNKVIEFSKLGRGSGIGLIFLKKEVLFNLKNNLKKDLSKWWIQHLDARDINLVCAKPGARWTEIDTESDLKKAKLLFEMTIGLDEYITAEELFELMREINFEGLHLTKRNLELERQALLNCVSFSVRHSGKLIGYARIFGDKTYYWSIWDVIVAPQYQGYGIGTDLMNAIISYIKKHQYIKIFLFSATGKEKFYSTFGFNKTRAEVMEIRND